ncbi:MAG: AtpZ/AtpI family protein [Bacteroidales bacterium]|nr:AtpZ/AtpI family protein [Bacteroidales bacterium]
MNKKSEKDLLRAYSKYSSIVIQVIAIIVGMAYLGNWIDKKLSTTKPWFTIVLSLLGVAAAIFILIKQLPRE